MFSRLAPVLGPGQNNWARHYDTKQVIFEKILHAAFMADKTWNFWLDYCTKQLHDHYLVPGTRYLAQDSTPTGKLVQTKLLF